MAGRNVCYQKPKEASFLKKLKEQVGYKEGPNVETKREKLPRDDNDSASSDTDEEKPVVVVLKEGDLTEEEADRIKSRVKQDEQPSLPESGKITFKKPVKREMDGNNTMTMTTSKRIKVSERHSASKKHQNDDDNVKKVKNKCLLSFDEEEDDD